VVMENTCVVQFPWQNDFQRAATVSREQETEAEIVRGRDSDDGRNFLDLVSVFVERPRFL